jgi:hypothetical protein
MEKYSVCIATYGHQRNVITTRLHGLDNVDDSTTSQELNSTKFSNDILWLYLKLADNTLSATGDYFTYRFFYVIKDSKGNIKFRLGKKNKWVKSRG